MSSLGVERNLFRYRPVPVAVRATEDASLQQALRVVIAGLRSGASFTLSLAAGLPAAVRRVLTEQDVPVFVETDEQWVQRIAASGSRAAAAGGAAPGAASGVHGDAEASRPPRVRIIGARESAAVLHEALAQAVHGDPDLAVYDNEVTTAGRLELLPFLHEQAIAITAHRFGNPDDWSARVI